MNTHCWRKVLFASVVDIGILCGELVRSPIGKTTRHLSVMEVGRFRWFCGPDVS